MKAEDITKLAAPFPRNAISWRAQTLNREGTKALALAYIDARDVMDRLDEVCGPANWQDKYEFHGPRTVCYLSIRVDGEWITKADGAGDSDVEAEKGAISDALKRAAVKWGIARYLYNMPNVWAPCECYDKNGKKQWSKWVGDPWDAVRNAPDKPVQTRQQDQPAKAQATPAKPQPNSAAHDTYAALSKDMRLCKTTADLARWWKDEECVKLRKTMPEDLQKALHDEFTKFGFELKRAAETKAIGSTVNDIQDTFPGSFVSNERIVSTLEAGE